MLWENHFGTFISLIHFLDHPKPILNSRLPFLQCSKFWNCCLLRECKVIFILVQVKYNSEGNSMRVRLSAVLPLPNTHFFLVVFSVALDNWADCKFYSMRDAKGSPFTLLWSRISTPWGWLCEYYWLMFYIAWPCALCWCSEEVEEQSNRFEDDWKLIKHSWGER